MMADVSVTTTNEIHGQVIQFFEVVWGMGDLVGSVPWKWRSKILNDGRMAWERWSLGLKYSACHDKQDSSRPHKAFGNKSLGDLERGITRSGLSLFNDTWSQKGHSVLCMTSFSTLANNQIWHQTVQQSRLSAWWLQNPQYSSGGFVGMYGLTYLLYHLRVLFFHFYVKFKDNYWRMITLI